MENRQLLMRVRVRPGPFLVAALTLVVVVAGVTESPAADATSTPAPTPSPSVGPSAAPAAPADKALGRIWWNRPEIVRVLQLTDAQRAKMDAILVHALDSQRAAQAQQVGKRNSFEAALVKGDWPAARKIAGEVGDRTAHLMAIQNELKIDILSVFGPQQRETLVAKYPHVLQRPWMLVAAPRRVRIRSGPPPTPAVNK